MPLGQFIGRWANYINQELYGTPPQTHPTHFRSYTLAPTTTSCVGCVWFVVVDKAAIFIDGRYVIQVVSEVDDTYVERHHFEEYPLLKWTADNITDGDRVGYDAELATTAWEAAARAAVRRPPPGWPARR